jgi:hypothetical protein
LTCLDHMSHHLILIQTHFQDCENSLPFWERVFCYEIISLWQIEKGFPFFLFGTFKNSLVNSPPFQIHLLWPK